MPRSDALKWERVTSPLSDHLLLLFPLASTSEANARELMTSMPKLAHLGAQLRQFDPGVQSVEVAVVELASVAAGTGFSSSCTYGLQITVRYPDYLSRAELQRRRVSVLAALVAA